MTTKVEWMPVDNECQTAPIPQRCVMWVYSKRRGITIGHFVDLHPYGNFRMLGGGVISDATHYAVLEIPEPPCT